MIYLLYGAFLVTVCIKQCILQSNIVLSLSEEIVRENTSATLTCSKTTGSLDTAKWITSMEFTQGVCGSSGDTCETFTFLTKKDLYDCICNDETISVMLKNVDRYQHGATWRCGDLQSFSNTVVINVSVPVTHAILKESSNRPINENATAKFTCDTSYSLPPALIRWYRSSESSTVEMQNDTDSSVQLKRKNFKTDDNLISVVETLSFRVNRSSHGWNIYCNVSSENSNLVMSNKLWLSVIFPPDRPPVIHQFSNGSTYKVIETKLAHLSCSVEGGNPLGKPKWLCKDIINTTSKELTTDNRTVTSLTWTAKRDQGKTCICKTDHLLSKEFVWVNIDVVLVYGASVKKFLMLGYENENPVIANESSRIEFICEMESNPISTVAITSPNGTILLSSDKNIIEYSYLLTSCLDSGIYSCSGSNDYNNGKYASAYISLLVNCKPMAYSPVQVDVRSELYYPVTLQFKAVAYPEPRFTWEMWTNSSWEQLTSNSITSISSLRMQSNLTLKNFASMEVRFFRLIVENFMGTLIQNYTLQPFAMETSTERSNIPVGLVAGSIIGVVAITVGIVLTCTLCLYRTRTSGRRDRKCKSTNNEKSNEEVFEMTTIADSITDGRLPPTQQTVYEDIIPHTDRGIIQRMENAYEHLRPNEGTVSEEV